MTPWQNMRIPTRLRPLAEVTALTAFHFNFGTYQTKNPKKSDYYRCMQDHFEQL
jgi:hypothetical protein